MAQAATIIELPLAQGQNEGIQREVLGPGPFSSLQNARFRKGRRLGKRHGYTSVSSLDASVAPLGNGSGRLQALGDNWCAVDDRFYQRNSVAGSWAGPFKPFSGGALGGTRLWGKFPEFAPAALYEPLQVQSDLALGGVAGTALPSIGGITVAQGYIWTCCAYYVAQAALGWLIRVVATDPATGLEVFQQDVQPNTSPAATDQMQPVLLSTGAGTVVLIYDHFTAGVKDGVRVVTLSSLTAGFGAEVAFACIQSAANYCPSSSTEILFVYTLTGTPATFTVARMNPVTMVASASGSRAAGGAKTLLSVFGLSSGLTWTGFTDGGAIAVASWDAALVLAGVSATWSAMFGAAATPVGPIVFAQRTSTSVCALANTTRGSIACVDHDSAAAPSARMQQFGCELLSQPLTIGSSVYVWLRHRADLQLGVATLVRVPLQGDYLNGAISPYTRAWVLEATIDDRDVDSPPAAATAGPTWPTPVLAASGYAALIAGTADSVVAGGGTNLLKRFFVAPVRHRSEGLRYAMGKPVACVSKNFVPGAQPMWVDALGATEAGFIQAPVSMAAPAAAGGGALSTNSSYSYVAYYVATDARGNTQRSGTSVPVSIGTGLNTKVTVTFGPLGLSYKQSVQLRLYRTLANGSVFYLVSSIDATPAASSSDTVVFVDVYADSEVQQNPPLYTQVGNELDAAPYPACQFGCVGGNRLWVGRPDLLQASKPIVPHVDVEFADDDAFRLRPQSGKWTGAAWLDALVAFTEEGIYLVSGDGPDASGQGFFAPAARLPFQVGCIEPRSVIAAEPGIFFQSARCMYLLPRGFGEPIEMDAILETLTSYPIITSAAAHYSVTGGRNDSEQLVQWTAVADEAATSGVVITYDVAHKAWSVDTFGADYPATFQAEWAGAPVLAPALTTQGAKGASYWHPFRKRDTGFSDGGLEIDMRGVLGDVRPFGEFAHGIINRMGVLGELRSACTFEVRQTTDVGESHWKERVYSLTSSQVGEVVYLEAAQGLNEQRDVTALRLSFHESSTSEGLAVFGCYIEHQAPNQGWRKLRPQDRVNVRPDAILLESGAEVLTTEDGEQIITEDGS